MIGHARVNYFELVAESNESLLMYDVHKKTGKIYWNGIVNLETARIILNQGANLVDEGKVTRILLSREFLTEFTSDAREWINEFLKARGRQVVKNVEKVATVKPSTKMGNLFSTLVSSSIKLVFPRLIMKQFNQEFEALEWLLSD